ncbi:MAG: PEP-CTERM sorting domain-containing protein [Planctomycetota bacterium]
MQRLLALFCLISVFLFSEVSTVSAAITVTIGSREIEAAPSQLLELFVTSELSDPQVSGVSLNLQLGDGLGLDPEPVFESFDFTGGIFGPTVVPTGGPVGGASQFAQAGGSLPSGTVAADGLLVRILIDASGFSPGESFDLLATGTAIGTPSQFFVPGPAVTPAVFLNGSIGVVSAIPEPGTAIALLAVFGAVSVRRRR